MPTSAILVVGDEILSGEVVDENAPFLLRAFAKAGVAVERVLTVPDREAAIVEGLAHLRAHADVVVVSGGIGPTHDDVTRPAVAAALGLPLVPHPEAERRIRAWYADRTTPAELSMAHMPAGATMLDGERTGTFGFALGGIYVLPGVPHLFRDIATTLPRRLGTRALHREVILTDRREGEIAPALAAVQGRSLDVAIGSYPVYEGGRWHVRIVLRGTDARRVAEVARDVRGRL